MNRRSFLTRALACLAAPFVARRAKAAPKPKEVIPLFGITRDETARREEAYGEPVRQWENEARADRDETDFTLERAIRGMEQIRRGECVRLEDLEEELVEYRSARISIGDPGPGWCRLCGVRVPPVERAVYPIFCGACDFPEIKAVDYYPGIFDESEP